jgi:hypothetical protein
MQQEVEISVSFLHEIFCHSSENCDFGPHELPIPPDGTCVALELLSLPFVSHLTFISRFRNWVQSRMGAWNGCKVWGWPLVPEVPFGGDMLGPCSYSVVYEWITYFVLLFPRRYSDLIFYMCVYSVVVNFTFMDLKLIFENCNCKFDFDGAKTEFWRV